MSEELEYEAWAQDVDEYFGNKVIGYIPQNKFEFTVAEYQAHMGEDAPAKETLRNWFVEAVEKGDMVRRKVGGKTYVYAFKKDIEKDEDLYK